MLFHAENSVVLCGCVPVCPTQCVFMLIFDVQLQKPSYQSSFRAQPKILKQKTEKKTHIKNKSLAFKVDVAEKKKENPKKNTNKQTNNISPNVTNGFR